MRAVKRGDAAASTDDEDDSDDLRIDLRALTMGETHMPPSCNVDTINSTTRRTLSTSSRWESAILNRTGRMPRTAINSLSDDSDTELPPLPDSCTDDNSSSGGARTKRRDTSSSSSGVAIGSHIHFPEADAKPAPPDTVVNMYGISVEPALADAYVKWIENDMRTLEARLVLFNRYLREGHGYVDKQLANGVCRGIPTNCRGRCWKLMTSAGESALLWPDFFDALLEAPRRAVAKEARSQIRRDLFRTFVDTVTERRDTSFAASLERVLLAYAAHNPEIGYAQGMNFIAGGFLQFMSENESFWMLKYVVEEMLPDTHGRRLCGAQADSAVVRYYIQKRLPRLHEHFRRIGLDVQMIVSRWTVSFFAESFPMETAFRIWDFVFYRGASGIFDVILCIMRKFQPALVQTPDAADAYALVMQMSAELYDIVPVLTTAMYQTAPLENGAVEMRRRRQRACLRGIEHGQSFDSVRSVSMNSVRATPSSDRDSDGGNTPGRSTPLGIPLTTPRAPFD